MSFFNTVEGKHHQCAMYNLYKSAYNNEKNNDSWCYEERNERHTTMSYTRGTEVKEGKHQDQENIKGST